MLWQLLWANDLWLRGMEGKKGAGPCLAQLRHDIDCGRYSTSSFEAWVLEQARRPIQLMCWWCKAGLCSDHRCGRIEWLFSICSKLRYTPGLDLKKSPLSNDQDFIAESSSEQRSAGPFEHLTDLVFSLSAAASFSQSRNRNYHKILRHYLVREDYVLHFS